MNALFEEKLGAIAYGLEAFMIDWRLIPWDEVPEPMKQYKDNDGPIGAGKHPKFGWFVLASGQGPFIVWIDYDLEKLCKEFADYRSLGG